MTRSPSCLALILLGAIQFGGTASFAQRPPSERELRVYAGLHDAAARGEVAEIQRLIREGEKPNVQDANSRTPLHVAAFLRQHGAARALLRLGANANALDAERYDILMIAAGNEDLPRPQPASVGGGNAHPLPSHPNDTQPICPPPPRHPRIPTASH